MTEMDLLRTELCHMREQRDMALMENTIDAKDLAYWRAVCRRLISEKCKAIRERDEARRLASENACITEMGVRAFARNKGWDCFKKENDNA